MMNRSRGDGALVSDLHASSQHSVKHMGSFFHESDVLRRGIGTLAVLNGVDEAVSELAERAQKVVLDEIHHAVIWEKESITLSATE